MERAIFFDEGDGARIDALLNPESLTWRRRAGVRVRSVDERPVMRPDAIDDPLVFTGGGETEIEVNLLFDTRLLAPRPGAAGTEAGNGATQRAGGTYRDVRDFTRPLWALTEPARLDAAGVRFGLRPQLLIWGEWSVRVVLVAIAERFEEFDASGTPRRAWLSVSLRRVEGDETVQRPDGPPGPDRTAPLDGASLEHLAHTMPDPGIGAGAGDLTAAAASARSDGIGRPDLLAREVMGDARLWPLLCSHLGIEDPLSVGLATPIGEPAPPAPGDTP